MEIDNKNIQTIFNELLKDEEFRNAYFMGFLDRFVYTTADIEEEINPNKRLKIVELMIEAFNNLINSEFDMLSPIEINMVGSIINREEGIAGFRKINVLPGEYAKWQPVAPSQIYYSLYSLIDNYYHIWNERDVFEKEAAFHIMLMRIHPFQDGNKRTSKLIMNVNFVKQNYLPVIINESETEIYYNFINNNDVMGFANFLKEKAIEELRILISQYKIYYKIPITKDIIEDILDSKKL